MRGRHSLTGLMEKTFSASQPTAPIRNAARSASRDGERVAMEGCHDWCSMPNVIRSLKFTTLATDVMGRSVDSSNAAFVYGARDPNSFV